MVQEFQRQCSAIHNVEFNRQTSHTGAHNNIEFNRQTSHGGAAHNIEFNRQTSHTAAAHNTEFNRQPSQTGATTHHHHHHHRKQPKESSHVFHVKTMDEYNSLLSHGKVIVIFTSRHCGPCKLMVPVCETLAKQHKNVKFLKVDLNDARLWDDMEISLDVLSLPTFKVYKDTTQVNKFVGARKQMLEETAANLAQAH